jgi:hypothetical protein
MFYILWKSELPCLLKGWKLPYPRWNLKNNMLNSKISITEKETMWRVSQSLKKVVVRQCRKIFISNIHVKWLQFQLVNNITDYQFLFFCITKSFWHSITSWLVTAIWIWITVLQPAGLFAADSECNNMTVDQSCHISMGQWQAMVECWLAG